MTDRLSTLLRTEADEIAVPAAPAPAVLRKGRSLRRRHRLAQGAAAAAVVAVVATAGVAGTRLLGPGSGERLGRRRRRRTGRRRRLRPREHGVRRCHQGRRRRAGQGALLHLGRGAGPQRRRALDRRARRVPVLPAPRGRHARSGSTWCWATSCRRPTGPPPRGLRAPARRGLGGRGPRRRHGPRGRPGAGGRHARQARLGGSPRWSSPATRSTWPPARESSRSTGAPAGSDRSPAPRPAPCRTSPATPGSTTPARRSSYAGSRTGRGCSPSRASASTTACSPPTGATCWSSTRATRSPSPASRSTASRPARRARSAARGTSRAGRPRGDLLRVHGSTVSTCDADTGRCSKQTIDLPPGGSQELKLAGKSYES